MRKWFMVVLVAALFALAIVPAAAQDMGTIADIVVSSATGDSPEFTTLLAAVQAADPSVLAALSDPEQSLTVFAPTDAAFAELKTALGDEAFNGILADQTTLTDILLFHVVSGKVMSSDVVNALEANEGAFSVPSLEGQYIDITQTDDGIFINGAKLNLDMVDIEASNGVIHVIDSVITPETRTIADIVVDSANMTDSPEFATLLAAVSAADPAVLETLSDPDAELTVFAPTDAAFTAAFEAMGVTAEDVLADTTGLTGILLYHVIPAVLHSGDITAALAPMTDGAEMMETPDWLVSHDDSSLVVNTANGATATISVKEDGVYINDAKVVMTDIDAANGVIHVIDAVIVPPSM